MESRYGIVPNDLKIYATNLGVGQGLSSRLNTPDFIRFILDAERIIEAHVSTCIAVPLKPVRVPSNVTQITLPAVPPAAPTVIAPNPNPSTSNWSAEVGVTKIGDKWNFPIEFIQSIIYLAVTNALRSEFFEAEGNLSQYVTAAEAESVRHELAFRSRVTVLVGAGRRRHANPHMPPNIAPPETQGFDVVTGNQ